MLLSPVAPLWLKDDVTLLSLCCWREDRGGTLAAEIAMCCSVRNRVQHPSWWGHSYREVILEAWQYSCFNPADPNATKYPNLNDPTYQRCLAAAQYAMNPANPDTSLGADSYFDASLDDRPPKWTKGPHSVQTVVIGRLRFWRTAPPAHKPVKH